MPPASRNQRAPRAGATPTPAAASSLERPAAIDTQNWRRSSRRATEGRPGDRNAPRRHRSERRLRVPIANPSVEVLRRPLEPAQAAAVAEAEALALLDLPAGELGAVAMLSVEPGERRLDLVPGHVRKHRHSPGGWPARRSSHRRCTGATSPPTGR